VKTDAIVVLTGGPNRIETGLDLLRDGAAQKLFVSGVDPRVTADKLIAAWGGDKNAVSCCVTLGHQAQNTAQNATEARDWAEKENVRSVRLVTAAWHIPRAWLEFHETLPGVKIVSHPVAASDAEIVEPWFWITAFAEYNKAILVSWRGWRREL
jgi:uncharacterized SAM-binding protein YcdF (DUF218 family)